MPHATAKTLHAAIENHTCHSEDWRSRILQLRPSINIPLKKASIEQWDKRKFIGSCWCRRWRWLTKKVDASSVFDLGSVFDFPWLLLSWKQRQKKIGKMVFTEKGLTLVDWLLQKLWFDTLEWLLKRLRVKALLFDIFFHLPCHVLAVIWKWKSFSHVQLFVTPWTIQWRIPSPWNSPGQNTGVGNLSLLQGIFLTQELNWGLLHCRQILYQLNYQGKYSLFIHILSHIKWQLPSFHFIFTTIL